MASNRFSSWVCLQCKSSLLSQCQGISRRSHDISSRTIASASVPSRHLARPCISSNPNPRRTSLPPLQPLNSRRHYIDPNQPPEHPYGPIQEAILSAAMKHVPTHGFTQDALLLGAKAEGYSGVSANLFPRGAFDLVMYHLVTQRLALKNVQFHIGTFEQTGLSVGAKVANLMRIRLHANEPVIKQLPQALGHMSLLENIPGSLRELALLVDEIWYLAGDKKVDGSWYIDRGMLAAVYSSCELFMTRDESKGFKDTDDFMRRRLEDVSAVGTNARGVSEWLSFTGMSTVNILRSWGVRL